MATLPGLPTELLNEIASFLPPHPARDRLHLALVSKQLRQISLPHFYSTIHLEHRDNPDDHDQLDLDHPSDPIRQLRSTLARNPSLRPLVHSLTLHTLYMTLTDWPLVALLPYLPSLTELRVQTRYEGTYQEIDQCKAISLEPFAAALQSVRGTLKSFSFFLEYVTLSHRTSIGSSLLAFAALETLEIQLSVLLRYDRFRGGFKEQPLTELLPPGLKELTVRCLTSRTERFKLRPQHRAVTELRNGIEQVLKFVTACLSRRAYRSLRWDDDDDDDGRAVQPLRKVVVLLPSWLDKADDAELYEPAAMFRKLAEAMKPFGVKLIAQKAR